MTETALSNLVAWAVQVGMLALVAAVVTRLVPIDAPVVRYAWWRTALVICLALPVIQPWQPPEALTSVVALDGTPPSPVLGAVVSGSASVQSPVITRATAPRWPSIIAMVLVSGALLRLAWLGAGLMRLRRLRNAGARADASDAPDFF
ncbi:MAG: hypothetical protein H0W08_11390 [Acidobacteria bacterium]|nr:hypothetical protein [Acidobacteriota bacterium]